MNRIGLLAAAALISASVAGCQKPEPAKPAVDTAKVSDAVKADANQLVADFNAHDAAKAVTHDAPGMIGMMHGTPNTVGVDADLANTKKQVADPAAKIAVRDENVDVATAGDEAIYRATYDYTFTDPKTKKPTTETGNWIIAYKLQTDGTWKIVWNVVSDTGNLPQPVAAATPAPAAAPAATPGT